MTSHLQSGCPFYQDMEVVLLGLSDGDLDPERYRASFKTNKLGGKPDWMLPEPSRQAPRCARCGAPLAHVVQAPIQEAPAASEWCNTAEDWGRKRRRKRRVERGGGIELFGEEDELHHAQKLLREYERREGVSAGEMEEEDGGGGEEKYEKTKARHGDAVFSRFMKKISLCPQQILRYSRRGKPLFISQPPENMQVPKCGSCGGERTFEMQLMPALVSLLRGRKRRREEKDEEEEVEVEFGTVLVFTCNNSCWTEESGSTVEEICFVQPDPDQKLFK
ncbi:hypothetical protein F7725_023451 [Dissostichus mawsoni]|uniref:Programmed cell death protein 2 C-terminal domain-containing protein n=1 Tax=Dissostichus mawsoni TaxID=36200 RepID=A0A7J5Z178_DISMA|nr:hypothetical protein F7725_023451 [Dissostichus mawsoni]